METNEDFPPQGLLGDRGYVRGKGVEKISTVAREKSCEFSLSTH